MTSYKDRRHAEEMLLGIVEQLGDRAEVSPVERIEAEGCTVYGCNVTLLNGQQFAIAVSEV